MPRRPAKADPAPIERVARSKRAKAEIDPLALLRALCLALPETTEKIAWGAPTFRVKDKIFAMYADRVHGDPRIAVWCAAPKGAQVVLVSSEPKRFFVPPYVGPRGWIGVVIDARGEERLARILREAYVEIAPPKLGALVADASG